MKQIRFRLQKTPAQLSFVIPPHGDELRLLRLTLGAALAERLTHRPPFELAKESPVVISPSFLFLSTNSETSIKEEDVWKSLAMQ